MDAQQPVCLPCCRQKLQFDGDIVRCNSCTKHIVAERPHIAQADFCWHADARCFCCSDCGRALLGKPYSLLQNGRLFCGPKGCARATGLNQNGAASLSPLPPPSFPPPPPPPPRFVGLGKINSAPTSPVENVYETVAPVPAPSTSSGCSANGSISSSGACSVSTPPQASARYYQLRRVPESDADSGQPTRRRRCRSADGRQRRRRQRRHQTKQKRMVQLQAAPAAPAGSALTAALALASNEKRDKQRSRRRRHNGRRHRDSSSSSLSDDDYSSSCSCSSSSYSSHSSISSTDDDDEEEEDGRRRVQALLRHHYCMQTRRKLQALQSLTTASESRIARTRPTTVQKNKKDNCRIS